MTSIDITEIYEEMKSEGFSPVMMSESMQGVEPMTKYSSEVFALIRKTIPKLIAEEIVGVQPMNADLKSIIDLGKSEEELLAEGYEPICPITRLMWVKK